MRRLTILEYISLDGIIQAPGGPGEDGDYPHGGWSAPFDDPVVDEALGAAQAEPFDLLLGRRTYDIWAGYWPAAAGPIADAFNAATKFVATHRPESLGWGPAQGVGPDIAGEVRRIKEGGGPDLILWGSSTLTPVLLEHGLADEVVLIVVPVLLGTGKRFFAEGTPPRELKLIRTRIGGSGVVIHNFQPAGPLRTGTFGQDTNRIEQEMTAMTALSPGKYVLTLDRLMDAPVENVWRCWTEPALLEEWFCPKPWRATEVVMDLRPGGEMTSVFRGPDGESFPNKGVFLAVEPMRRIVSTDAFRAGWVPSERAYMVTETLLAEAGQGRTHMIWRALHWNEETLKEHEAMGFHDGWGAAAAQLEALAKSL